MTTLRLVLSVLNRSYSFFHIRRTTIKAGMSLNFVKIPSPIMELAPLYRRLTSPNYTLMSLSGLLHLHQRAIALNMIKESIKSRIRIYCKNVFVLAFSIIGSIICILHAEIVHRHTTLTDRLSYCKKKSFTI